MKIKNIVMAAAAILLLATGNAWAGNSHQAGYGKPLLHITLPKIFHHAKPPKGPKGGSHHHHKAPEINAASGTSAIALLTGVLLLTGERIRSRRA